MPSRHRFLEPIHNVKEGAIPPTPRRTADLVSSSLEILRGEPCTAWWSLSGSNRRPQACKASALPTELWPHWIKPLAMVGRVGVEPTTSRLSGVRSNHLSYRPPHSPAGLMAAGGVSQLRLHSPQPFLGSGSVSRMKGHEDGGNVLWNGGSTSGYESRRFPPKSLERR